MWLKLIECELQRCVSQSSSSSRREAAGRQTAHTLCHQCQLEEPAGQGANIWCCIVAVCLSVCVVG